MKYSTTQGESSSTSHHAMSCTVVVTRQPSIAPVTGGADWGSLPHTLKKVRGALFRIREDESVSPSKLGS